VDSANKATKESQKALPKSWPPTADVYVNDAFGTAHRAPRSTALIADHFDAEHKLFGYLLPNEINAVEKVMKDTNGLHSHHGWLQSVLENRIHPEPADTGGQPDPRGGHDLFTFVKADGGKIGDSIVEDDKLDLARELVALAKEKG